LDAEALGEARAAVLEELPGAREGAARALRRISLVEEERRNVLRDGFDEAFALAEHADAGRAAYLALERRALLRLDQGGELDEPRRRVSREESADALATGPVREVLDRAEERQVRLVRAVMPHALAAGDERPCRFPFGCARR